MSKTAVEEPNAVVKWISGNKTYAVAAAILVRGILAHYGIEVPVYVDAALLAFGLGFLRAGVKKSAP